jgi:hypothetical protein
LICDEISGKKTYQGSIIFTSKILCLYVLGLNSCKKINVCPFLQFNYLCYHNRKETTSVSGNQWNQGKQVLPIGSGVERIAKT